MFQNILILGGAGFIGTNLTLRLLADGHRVTVLDRSGANYAAFQNLENLPTLAKINLLDFEKVKHVINSGKFDTVIHLIANVVPGSSFEEFLAESDLNIKTGFKLLDEIYRAGIPNFIYFSSGGTVYGNNGLEVNAEQAVQKPISLYGWYKSAMEQYIQTYTHTHPLNYCILRPSNPYGYYQNIYAKQGFIAVAMGKVINNYPIEIWGTGEVVRDYVFIDDVSAAVSALINRGYKSKIFNLGSGGGHSLNEIVAALELVCGSKVAVNYSPGRNIDVSKNILDVSALKNYLSEGGQPWVTTKLQTGISQMWQWVNTNLPSITDRK